MIELLWLISSNQPAQNMSSVTMLKSIFFTKLLPLMFLVQCLKYQNAKVIVVLSTIFFLWGVCVGGWGAVTYLEVAA